MILIFLPDPDPLLKVLDPFPGPDPKIDVNINKNHKNDTKFTYSLKNML
jgi:hypothetical protein